ncbi:MAG: hypothetical protein WA309_18510 [Pseudolabrys sp.]
MGTALWARAAPGPCQFPVQVTVASPLKTLATSTALPAAFRIWVVTHPTPSALEPSPDTQHEQEPLYSSPRSAVKRVLSTNCCRQSSD